MENQYQLFRHLTKIKTLNIKNFAMLLFIIHTQKE